MRPRIRRQSLGSRTVQRRLQYLWRRTEGSYVELVYARGHLCHKFQERAILAKKYASLAGLREAGQVLRVKPTEQNYLMERASTLQRTSLRVQACMRRPWTEAFQKKKIPHQLQFFIRHRAARNLGRQPYKISRKKWDDNSTISNLNTQTELRCDSHYL
jgi:hypothetical protein